MCSKMLYFIIRVAADQLCNSCGVHGGDYGKIGKFARHAEISSYAFAYVFAMFTALPLPLVDSIMGAGEAANIAKT